MMLLMLPRAAILTFVGSSAYVVSSDCHEMGGVAAASIETSSGMTKCRTRSPRPARPSHGASMALGSSGVAAHAQATDESMPPPERAIAPQARLRRSSMPALAAVGAGGGRRRRRPTRRARLFARGGLVGLVAAAGAIALAQAKVLSAVRLPGNERARTLPMRP